MIFMEGRIYTAIYICIYYVRSSMLILNGPLALNIAVANID